jgi:hypothetical protein
MPSTRRSGHLGWLCCFALRPANVVSDYLWQVRGETPAARDDGVQAANDCVCVARQLLLDPRVVRCLHIHSASLSDRVWPQVPGGGAAQAQAAAAALLVSESIQGPEQYARTRTSSITAHSHAPAATS